MNDIWLKMPIWARIVFVVLVFVVIGLLKLGTLVMNVAVLAFMGAVVWAVVRKVIKLTKDHHRRNEDAKVDF